MHMIAFSVLRQNNLLYIICAVHSNFENLPCKHPIYEKMPQTSSIGQLFPKIFSLFQQNPSPFLFHPTLRAFPPLYLRSPPYALRY